MTTEQEAEKAYASLLKRKGKPAPLQIKAAPRKSPAAKSPADKGKVRPRRDRDRERGWDGSTHMYTHAAKGWPLSIVQGHFLSPRASALRFATFSPLYVGVRSVGSASAGFG